MDKTSGFYPLDLGSTPGGGITTKYGFYGTFPLSTMRACNLRPLKTPLYFLHVACRRQQTTCAVSSVGRAARLHREGREFKSLTAH